MTIERDDIKEIVNAVAVAGIEEFSLEIGDVKVRLRKTAAPAAAPVAAARTAPASAPPTATTAPAPPKAAAASADTGALVAVTAPLIGTFYRSPALGEPPFVEVGARVEPEDTVCIVEVMKLMNAVRAGCRGRVVEICAENGALVEYGQTMMLIDPAP
jgi:acetyl-CoA carboxylase biotin carboxyl carrier protein